MNKVVIISRITPGRGRELYLSKKAKEFLKERGFRNEVIRDLNESVFHLELRHHPVVVEMVETLGDKATVPKSVDLEVVEWEGDPIYTIDTEVNVKEMFPFYRETLKKRAGIKWQDATSLN